MCFNIKISFSKHLPGLEIRAIHADQTIPLRHTVIWPNHPPSHVLLPEDDSGHHYGAFLHSNDLPVAVISVFREPLPVDFVPGSVAAVRFRKFACDIRLQGQGIGTKLLKHIFTLAHDVLAADAIWCDARLSTASWYQRRGMTQFGPTFFKHEVEYVRMRASLCEKDCPTLSHGAGYYFGNLQRTVLHEAAMTFKHVPHTKLESFSVDVCLVSLSIRCDPTAESSSSSRAA